jgi:hypothetical protein
MNRALSCFALGLLLHCNSTEPANAVVAQENGDAAAEPGGEAGSPETPAPDGGKPPTSEICGNADISPSACTCAPAIATGTFKLPAHTSYARYTFGNANFASLQMKVTVVKDPGDQVGLYVAPFNGYIDGTLTYLGLQSNVTNNKLGTRTGKGIVFSRWATLDPEDTKIATGGFLEVGTHEGEFVGIRLNYPWTVGTYTLSLDRAQPGVADGERDWFELSVTDAANKKTFVGALRFPRKVPGTRASVSPSTTLFTEVYMGATEFAKVPALEIEVTQLADGKAATRVKTEYPAYPNMEKFPNTDAYYIRSRDTMHFTYGGSTQQCHAAGTLK